MNRERTVHTKGDAQDSRTRSRREQSRGVGKIAFKWVEPQNLWFILINLKTVRSTLWFKLIEKIWVELGYSLRILYVVFKKRRQIIDEFKTIVKVRKYIVDNSQEKKSC
jgi:hypothetical protein